MDGTRGRKWLRLLGGLSLVFLLAILLLLFSDGVLKKLYPLSHGALIRENAKTYELDPALVAAVIHVDTCRTVPSTAALSSGLRTRAGTIAVP